MTLSSRIAAGSGGLALSPVAPAHRRRLRSADRSRQRRRTMCRWRSAPAGICAAMSAMSSPRADSDVFSYRTYDPVADTYSSAKFLTASRKQDFTFGRRLRLPLHTTICAPTRHRRLPCPFQRHERRCVALRRSRRQPGRCRHFLPFRRQRLDVRHHLPGQRLCRSRHLCRDHALCRRGRRLYLCQLVGSQQHELLCRRDMPRRPRRHRRSSRYQELALHLRAQGRHVAYDISRELQGRPRLSLSARSRKVRRTRSTRPSAAGGATGVEGRDPGLSHHEISSACATISGRARRDRHHNGGQVCPPFSISRHCCPERSIPAATQTFLLTPERGDIIAVRGPPLPNEGLAIWKDRPR